MHLLLSTGHEKYFSLHEHEPPRLHYVDSCVRDLKGNQSGYFDIKVNKLSQTNVVSPRIV